ncbi:hypothetical protein PR048_018489 [Dryococelus australis]|uniref:Uncharacterized protein n=1 Tax=Dryococelus australis TaxID=614101 RepID=A0ABQ9HCF3_9NEOP|nr:hypothetical protein PR048_018489 [Dryococelus australis]
MGKGKEYSSHILVSRLQCCLYGVSFGEGEYMNHHGCHWKGAGAGKGLCCDDCSSFHPSSSKAKLPECQCACTSKKIRLNESEEITDDEARKYFYAQGINREIYFVTRNNSCKPANKILSEQQQNNHVALRASFTIAKYLARQGLAFRSHDDI